MSILNDFLDTISFEFIAWYRNLPSVYILIGIDFIVSLNNNLDVMPAKQGPSSIALLSVKCHLWQNFIPVLRPIFVNFM